jgi:hypothetical protein
MSNISVQFSDATLSAIVAVFCGPQDGAEYPHQGQVEDSDQRYIAFINPGQTVSGKWSAIKAERDRRTEYGGCKVDGRWYDTDARSALRYKLLADQAAAEGLADDAVVRAGWRPMDVDAHGEVDMTFGRLKRIMAAGIVTAMAIDDAAQLHRANMIGMADPSNYDYSGQWPESFLDL